MNIQIKKENKVKRFKLINTWSDVTLDRWIKLLKFTDTSKPKEAKETIAALSDIPKNLIDKLALKDVALIMGKISELQEQQDNSLRKIIDIEGKEYAFHPDLDSITLGEYADLETFIGQGVKEKLPELMAILYRPIIEKLEDGNYTIPAYDGNISKRAEQMKKMSSEQVQGALVFFYNLGKELLRTLPSVLTQQLQEMRRQSQQNPLPTSGRGSV